MVCKDEQWDDVDRMNCADAGSVCCWFFLVKFTKCDYNQGEEHNKLQSVVKKQSKVEDYTHQHLNSCTYL